MSRHFNKERTGNGIIYKVYTVPTKKYAFYCTESRKKILEKIKYLSERIQLVWTGHICSKSI